MKIIKHQKPDLNMPIFQVDGKLSKYLDNDELLKNLNQICRVSFIGPPRSGKTSLMMSFLTTKKKFKKVFHKIYVFMPSTSRASIKASPFNELPEEQLFERVDHTSLSHVYNEILENSKEKKLSLIVFDDVQSYLKEPANEQLLLHISANSRHLRTCMFFCVQNYNKLSMNLRKIMTHYFLFSTSKKEYEKIYEEVIDIDKKDWITVIKEYKKEKEKDEHSFIFIDVNKNKLYINWNEVIIEE